MKAKQFVSIVYESHYHNLCLEDTRCMHHYVDISTALPYHRCGCQLLPHRVFYEFSYDVKTIVYYLRKKVNNKMVNC